MDTNSKNLLNRKGFSLAEAMIAVVVLSVAAGGVLLPFSSGARMRAEGIHRTLAAKLAGDLMEEITKTPYDQILNDFAAYTESQGQVKDTAGVIFSDSNYTNFSRTASCQLVYVPQEATETMPPKSILATVTVYYSGKEIAVINRLISEK